MMKIFASIFTDILPLHEKWIYKNMGFLRRLIYKHKKIKGTAIIPMTHKE